MLEEQLDRYHTEPVAGLPPFQGGAAGLFGYDLCHHIERLPRPRHDEFAVPDLAVGLYDWVLAFDQEAGRAGWSRRACRKSIRRAAGNGRSCVSGRHCGWCNMAKWN